ncbi:MAG: AAA family ATPase, partial [Gammaproteobacteria bacterium]|nr:AAA family ATPase [Gammaproteobacteria bacterium]
MRLRRLTINHLPGITPGFTFEPPDAGVTIVTGPNAIGKSSLARALKHLLSGIDRNQDPPALSLEAEFDSGDTHWQVTRNGGQIVWVRDGEAATAPSLPSGDQIN